MKRHYPIIIVICCFLLAFVNMGLTSTSFNVFQSALVDVEGVGNVGASLVVTIRTFVAFVCMFFTHRYFERIGVRRGLAVASACAVGAFAVYGCSSALWGYCLGAVLAGAAYGLGGMVGVTVLIGRWFERGTGTAIGWAAVGSGVATFVVPLYMVAVIDSVSLAAGFFLDGAMALGIAAVALAFLRERPEAVGIAPFGAGDARRTESTTGSSSRAAGDAGEKPAGGTPVAAKSDAAGEVDYSRADAGIAENAGSGGAKGAGEARGSQADADAASPAVATSAPLSRAAYRAMTVAMVLLGSISMVGLAYLGILFTSEHVDATEMALMLSSAGIALTVSKLAVGVVCDRLGITASTLLFYGALAIGMLCCFLTGWMAPLAWPGAVLTGVGIALGSTGISLWSLRLSTPETRLRTVRTFQTAFAFGGFVFNLAPGVIADITGSYAITYGVLFLFAVASAAIVIACLRRSR